MLSPSKYNAVKKRWKMSSAAFEFQNQTVKSHADSKGYVFVEPSVPSNTPRKVLGPSTAPSLNQANMGPLTTPTKQMEGPSGEPWTPTSNLKMLISAASPDIRNREKELCVKTEEALVYTQDAELGEEAEKFSRKEKSLGLLCHKFLARYQDYPNPAVSNEICLDDVATELNVERRRLYDIMNVLESLHMVSRLVKNRYTWHGRGKLALTLGLLRQEGQKHRYGQQMQQIRRRCWDGDLDCDGKENEGKENEEVQTEMPFVELPGVEFKAASVNSRKDNSLRMMSQKFVMLFLVSRPPIVSLELAAKILIGESHMADQDKNKFKTKVRRLYDIANVLQSLELIEKVHVTEERGRKPAFKWIGTSKFDLVEEDPCCPPAAGGVLESRGSVENCAKNLFSARGKHGFTRHPSLIKLAKSIQDDRRKINSAPSSPVKNALSDSPHGDIPSKMAQLAAICKLQLDQQAVAGDRGAQPAIGEAAGQGAPHPPQQAEARANATPQLAQRAAPPPGSISYVPAHCSPLFPVLLPQRRGNGPYAVYLHPSALRPAPTSLAVRSMTFEEKSAGQSPIGAAAPSPPAAKRQCSDPSDLSPPQAKCMHRSFKDTSPQLSEILQARLKALRGDLASGSRPSPRALHLDPEFLNTPGAGGGGDAGANHGLEESVENFLEREDAAVAGSDSEAGLTPVRAVPLTPGGLHAEMLVPAGYLVPLPQQPVLGYKEPHGPGGEGGKASTPTYNIYHTPTAGSRLLPLEVTPTGLRLDRPCLASPPSLPLRGPSPAIFNFTLQNVGLIPPQTPEPPPRLAVQPKGLLFVRPLSPATLQGQPLTLISVPQTTPNRTGLPQHSFFHTPVSLSPLATVVTASGHAVARNVYAPQRKLDVSAEDS